MNHYEITRVGYSEVLTIVYANSIESAEKIGFKLFGFEVTAYFYS